MLHINMISGPLFHDTSLLPASLLGMLPFWHQFGVYHLLLTLIVLDELINYREITTNKTVQAPHIGLNHKVKYRRGH